MDGLRELLDQLKQQGTAQGHFLGLLHILIGRRITRPDGSVITPGMTWRELARLLKRLRWDREAVAELGLNPDALPVRDREKYWYTAITQARLDSPAAVAAGDLLAEALAARGYVVGPAPRA